MSDIINPPPLAEINPALASWFTQVYMACFSVQQSGTTTQRPIRNLWVGRMYFDTTIYRPIWYTGTNWIKADGTIA